MNAKAVWNLRSGPLCWYRVNSHPNPIDLLWSYSIKCHLRSVHSWRDGIHTDRDALQCELCRQEFREMRGSPLGAIVAELDEVTVRASIKESVTVPYLHGSEPP